MKKTIASVLAATLLVAGAGTANAESSEGSLDDALGVLFPAVGISLVLLWSLQFTQGSSNGLPNFQ